MKIIIIILRFLFCQSNSYVLSNSELLCSSVYVCAAVDQLRVLSIVIAFSNIRDTRESPTALLCAKNCKTHQYHLCMHSNLFQYTQHVLPIYYA